MSIKAMIAASPIAAVVTDPRQPDNPIIACNKAFEVLTGYGSGEILGRNCRFLAGLDTERELSQQLRSGQLERRPVLIEILNYKKDGTPFRNALLVAPIFDDHGELEYFIGSQMEVPELPGQQSADRQLIARHMIDALSPQRRAVLIAMAAGKRNKQIAFAMAITERTVKMHRAAVLASLEVKSSADAIRIAIEAGY